MSLGYGGVCNKALEDEETVIYTYRGQNLNLPKEDEERIEGEEGMFTIQKSALEEPEIYERIVRGPNGRKKLVRKKIMHYPHIDTHIEDGTVKVDKLCGVDVAFKESGRFPRCAFILIRKVFEHYMEEGTIPDKEAFFQ
jgi:hypothetical protein